MNVSDIYIKDFLSIGAVRLQLPKSGLILVTGWDKDLGRANGAGKSSLFLALCWCLYGELPRNIKVDELIRRGQKSCLVAVKFTIEDVEWIVTRQRPSGLELTIGGVKQKGNPKYLQAVIEQSIGLDYKQFLITSYFPQKGDSSRFLNQNDSAAKDFLASVLNFNKIEAAYKKLHLEMKDLDTVMSIKKGELSSSETSLERFRMVSDMPIPPMPDKEQVLAVKRELELIELSTKSVPDTSAIDHEIAKITQAVQKVQQAKYDIVSNRNMIETLQRQIDYIERSEAHTMECPSCAADLLETNGKLVTFDESSALEQKRTRVATLQESINQKIATNEKLEPLIQHEQKLQSKLDDAKAKKLGAYHDYNMSKQRKEHLKQQMDSFKQAILASHGAKQQKDKIAEQLREVESAITKQSSELKSLEKEFMLLSAAKAVMSPTGMIAYSLDSILSELNDNVSEYLDIFSHGTMTYRISSGDDKAKVTHTVTKNGDTVSVGSLSGGEEKGLTLSVDLGLGKVIVSRSGVSLPSVLMLDECFDGLDSVGKEKVLDALREIAHERCIIVVDHATEFNALFDKAIKVVKQNEISSVEEA